MKFLSIFTGVFEHPLLPALMAILLIFFIIKYMLPARQLSKSIKIITRKLKALKQSKSPDILSEIDSIFKETKLSRLWEEYRETIHKQINNDTIAYRATIQSSQMFSPQSAVETHIHVEFFKHLPGIMTGLGIIGTFFGMMKGLVPFKNGLSDPSQTQKSVETLLAEVQSAFSISAIAICIAIAITILEKIVYNWLLQILEELCLSMDDLFQLGVGEEYLSKLVFAAEGTHDKTRQLKDAMVNDLKSMMENLTTAQIQAMATNNIELGKTISNSIQETFQEPLKQISQSVQSASLDQSQSVQGMLASLLTAFMDKLEGNVGGQFSAMESLMSKMVLTLDETRKGMEQTLVQLQNAGNKGIVEMSNTLLETQAKASEQQQEIQKSLEEFLKKNSEAQNENIKMLLEDLRIGQKETIETLANQSNIVGQTSRQVINDMGSEVNRMTVGIESAINHIGSSVQGLHRHAIQQAESTNNAIDGLNSAASNLLRTSESLKGSWKETDNVIERSHSIVAELIRSSSALEQGTRNFYQLLEAQAKERDRFKETLEEMQKTLDAARASSHLSIESRNQLQEIVSQLSAATTEYITAVPEALSENFKKYTDTVSSSMDQTISKLDGTLSSITDNFMGVLDEFSTVIGQFESAKVGRNK